MLPEPRAPAHPPRTPASALQALFVRQEKAEKIFRYPTRLLGA